MPALFLYSLYLTSSIQGPEPREIDFSPAFATVGATLGLMLPLAAVEAKDGFRTPEETTKNNDFKKRKYVKIT